MSYIAQRGSIDERLEWLRPQRELFNVVVDRNGIIALRPFTKLNDYNVDCENMLSFEMSCLPNQSTNITGSVCVSTFTDDESGESKSKAVLGHGTSLNMSFPTQYADNVAGNGFVNILKLSDHEIDFNNIIYSSAGSMPSSTPSSSSFGILYIYNNVLSQSFAGYTAVKTDDGSYKWQTARGLWQYYDYLPSSFEWFGDLNMECGDCFQITDELGNVKNFPLLSMSIEYDGSIKQKFTALGASSSSITLEQNSRELSEQIEQSYPLIQNSVKKVAYTGNDNTGMVALVDAGNDNIPDSLVVSEFSSNDSDANWLTDGKVVKIDTTGIKISNSGFRGEYSLYDNFNSDRLLWQGAYYMLATQTITLAQKVSEQPKGIVLVFSAYENGAAKDYQWHDFFVPKQIVEAKPKNGHTFMLCSGNFSAVGMKYIYIGDEQLTGNENNDKSQLTTPTNSGIKYNNAHWVLRYVYGV